MTEVQAKLLSDEILKSFEVDPEKAKKLARWVLTHFDPQFFTRSEWDRAKRLRFQIIPTGNE